MRILTVPSEPQTTTVSADLDRASNAPISRLPLELLVEIFKELLRRIIDDRDLYPNPLTRLECTVAHVCRFWRHVAYNTPTLWTFISYPIDSYLRRYLPLSGDCLLDLELGGLRHVPLTILKKLRPLAPRWHSLRICANSEENFHEIQTWLTPQLDYLQIYLQYSHSLNSHDVANFLTNAPRLRHLTINARSRRGLNSWSKVLFSRHLTSLTLEIACLASPSIDILLKQCCERLGELVLDAFHIEPQPGPSKKPVNLPALKRLRVRSHSCDILKYIDTPNIEEMVLDCTPGPTVPALLVFLRCPTAAMGVRRLEVNLDWATRIYFIRALSQMTHLEELRCKNVNGTIASTLTVLNTLIRPNNGILLLPTLTYIQLSDDNVTTRVYKKSLSSRAVRSAFCRYGSVGIARLLRCKGEQNGESWYRIVRRAFCSRQLFTGGDDWGIYAIVIYDIDTACAALRGQSRR
ncbi:hypothetical protein EV122DRAFT_210213 [Schizophyllum commune]